MPESTLIIHARSPDAADADADADARFATLGPVARRGIFRVPRSRRARARAESRRIEIEHERLDLETRTQATPLRVEKLAREQLGMRGINPAITAYVNDPRKDAQDQPKEVKP